MWKPTFDETSSGCYPLFPKIWQLSRTGYYVLSPFAAFSGKPFMPKNTPRE